VHCELDHTDEYLNLFLFVCYLVIAKENNEPESYIFDS